jgi:hypothetical protein
MRTRYRLYRDEGHGRLYSLLGALCLLRRIGV